MPRNRKHIRSQGPFHIGARANNREWFDLPIQDVWVLATDLLSFVSRAYNLQVQAYVLMSNHYHALVSAPESNLPEAMNYYQRELSKAIARDTYRINHVFGGPFFASLIDDSRYLHAVYKYIYRNPVDADICGSVVEYPYSSLRVQLGYERNMLTVIDPLDLHENPDSVLRWLDEPYKEEQRECIRRGLRQAKFQWSTGASRRNCWTDDLVFRTNAEGCTKGGRTFDRIISI